MRWVNQMTGGLSLVEFRVLSAMASYASNTGTRVFPSRARIERNTGLSRSSVQRAIRKLRAEGWLLIGDQGLVAHRPIGQRPVVYELNLSKRWSDTPDPEANVPASDDDLLTMDEPSFT